MTNSDNPFKTHADLKPSVFLLSTNFLQSRLYSFLKLSGPIAISCVCTIQCSWTPEIETSLHHSQEGTISLQTTQAFKIPPQHPTSISDSSIQEILEGISQTQESGLLQQLLSGPAAKQQIFSPSQVRFLAPQLALAFSQATPDELVSFTCAATDENSSIIRGTVAIFPSSLFLITVKNSQNSLVVHNKGENSSGLLQENVSMEFSKTEVVLPREEAMAYMTLPSNSNWIAINFAQLGTSALHTSQPQPTQSNTPIPSNLEVSDSVENESVKEQLRELRRKVEEQTKEIKRLEQTIR